MFEENQRNRKIVLKVPVARSKSKHMSYTVNNVKNDNLLIGHQTQSLFLELILNFQLTKGHDFEFN